MSVVTGLMVYLVLWWLIFFMMLPIGVRSHGEAGEDVVPGTPESAPVRPMLWRKAFAATLVAGLLWSVFYLADTYGWLGFNQ